MTEQDTARGLVVICTRNRPDDLAKALTAVDAVAPGIEVLVADSSDEAHLPEVRDAVGVHDGATLLACTPGLARQRNQALDWVTSHRPETTYVHFIDDDTEVLPGYVDAIVETFAARPELAGVGGVVLNQPRPRHVGTKRLFCLYSRTPGRVLPSGRVTIGHYEGDEATAPVWLPGCAMSYRTASIAGRRFDDRLEGYSLGEDMYFSFALSHDHPLAIAPEARVLHHFSPQNRLSRTRLAPVKIALLHRFVRENTAHGMRVSAFWLAVLGDMALKLADGVRRGDSDSVAEAGAIARGAWHALRHPLPTGPVES
jgi:glycosyltransferase involved in cell wall biosynthesis